MLSARYIAYHLNKFKRNVFFGKHRSIKRRKDFKLIKLNTNSTAKFTLCIFEGEFGFFYYAFSFNSCYAVGCRSPPNQSKPKNLD